MFLTLSLTVVFEVQITSSQQVADSAEMIKTITGIPNVTFIPNNATAFGFFGTGESGPHFSMAVPEEGFEFYVETTLKPGNIFEEAKRGVRDNGTQLGPVGEVNNEIAAKTLVFGVYPDGLVTGYHMENVFKFHFPPLNTLPAFGNGKRILKLRLSWTNMTLPFFLKFPWSVRILTREPISTTKTTEMPTTMEYLDDGTMTTLNHAFLRDKWWLIVNIGTAFVVVSSVMSAFLIYKSFRLRALSNSNDVSTTMDLQTTEVSNANGVVITSEDPANRPPAMPES